MGDFGAWACDFHSDFVSDFVSDFRTEGNDYSSDFRNFPGDFGGAPRTAKQPPEATEISPPEQGKAADKATGERERRQAGSASGKSRSRGQRHAIRP